MPMRKILKACGKKPGNAPARVEVADRIRHDAPVGDSQRLALLDAIEETELGWFWATDAEHRLTYLSPPAARRFGDRQVLDRQAPV